MITTFEATQPAQDLLNELFFLKFYMKGTFHGTVDISEPHTASAIQFTRL